MWMLFEQTNLGYAEWVRICVIAVVLRMQSLEQHERELERDRNGSSQDPSTPTQLENLGVEPSDLFSQAL